MLIPPSPAVFRSKQAFSLIELVCVMALIAALAAFSSWSLPGVVRAAKLREAGSVIVQASELARQLAVGRNISTALVVLTGANHSDARYRAVAALAFDAQAGIWTPLTDWVHLPEGTSILETEGNNSFLIGAATLEGDLLLSHRGQEVQKEDLAARIYTSSGQVLCMNANAPLDLRISDCLPAERAHFVKVEINPQNGRSRVCQE